MKNKIATTALLATLVQLSSHMPPVLAEPVSAETLAEVWDFYGDGLRKAERGMFYMRENYGSSGVMIVSPEAYGQDFTLEYEVMPMTAASVLVVLMSASDSGDESSLTLPANYDGSARPWLSNIESYFFAYHNAAHNVTPFINRLPGPVRLATYPVNLFETGKFSEIRIARQSGRLVVRVDNELFMEANDPQPLGPGFLAFRIRGLSEEPAACLIRNVVVISH